MKKIPRDIQKSLLADPVAFVQFGSGLKLRSYQANVMRALARSVLLKRGLTFVVMFPRQSGKNELQAQLETYLLAVSQELDAEMVQISPTWKPQSLNAMRRLQRVLEGNLLTRGIWQKESGYIYRVGKARIFFLSGSPEANIVGATANLLLSVDEAQDIQISKFEKEIAPMAASTNATRVFWGTAWTSQTLLALELRAAREAQNRDGIQRLFIADADAVAAEVPAYGRFVAAQVARLGRSHPMVRTKFYSEEIDGDGGMFPPERRALMRGNHSALDAPRPDRIYAMLLDVAGQDEAILEEYSGEFSALRNPSRDATALTVVEVDASTLSDLILRAPTYRCVLRRQWIGEKHDRLYAELLALAETWRARCLVVDATGVGAGLAAFLSRALPGRVISFQFNASSKSKLGWDFLAIVDSGRWKEPAGEAVPLADCFQAQLQFCQYHILPGPEKRMRWGVPDGTRNPASGELVHDDLLLSTALCAVLENQNWTQGTPALIVPGRDPLQELDSGF